MSFKEASGIKRFVLKLAVGACALLIPILCVNALYVRTDYYRTLNGMDTFRTLPSRIEAANFGNSHSNRAFDWSLCPDVAGANMALDSQTLAYDRNLLRQYYDRFADNALLFLSVSEFSLYIRQVTIEENGAAATRYYPVLDPKNIDDFSLSAALKYRYLPALGASIAGLSHIVRDIEPYVETVYDISGSAPEALAAIGQTRIDAAVASCDGTVLGVEYEALCDMLDMARQKNMRVVLVTPPTTKYYDGAWPSDFAAAFARDMAALLSAHPELIWLNYNGDARICDDLTLFSDVDHLNARGRNAFMRLLSEDLAAHGIALRVFQ